jgi:ferrochelatase
VGEGIGIHQCAESWLKKYPFTCLLGRELAEEVGITNWRRVPALNTNVTFIDDLADAVLEALPYVGSVAGSAASDALVPLGRHPWSMHYHPPQTYSKKMVTGPIGAGEVDALLETYDRDRKVLPPPVLVWQWGWTKSAETWNGRIAMLSIIIILLLEVTTGQGVLSNLLAL